MITEKETENPENGREGRESATGQRTETTMKAFVMVNLELRYIICEKEAAKKERFHSWERKAARKGDRGVRRRD